MFVCFSVNGPFLAILSMYIQDYFIVVTGASSEVSIDIHGRQGCPRGSFGLSMEIRDCHTGCPWIYMGVIFDVLGRTGGYLCCHGEGAEVPTNGPQELGMSPRIILNSISQYLRWARQVTQQPLQTVDVFIFKRILAPKSHQLWWYFTLDLL